VFQFVSTGPFAPRIAAMSSLKTQYIEVTAGFAV